MTRPAADPSAAVFRLITPARVAAAALLAAVGVGALSSFAQVAAERPRLLPGQEQPPDGTAGGKEHNEFVFVRDSAGAQEKFALAQKMERLKEWNKSADLYQEVLEKYRDRVIPDGKDKNNVINRYTSVTWGVLRQLSKWPQEGLDVYRGRYEPKAAELLAGAKGEDLGPLYEAFRKYFVTESGKQAGIRLIDANLERGEYAAAAEIGDQLLTTYPKQNLVAERPALLFRTALAHRLTGDAESRKKADERAAALTREFPKEMGVVRGADAVLADALKAELAALAVPPDGGTAAAGVAAAADSWPTFGGGPTRGAISDAKANAGTRLYSVPLAAPNFNNVPAATRRSMQEAHATAGQNGLTAGVMPAVDRGELFFQDGARVYAVNLESGQPLAGWRQSYPNTDGQYLLPNVTGSTRLAQQTVTVTDRHVLAVMGQPDRNLMIYGVMPQGEPRLVCLDRATGKELWTVALAQAPDVPKNEDEKAVRALTLSGAPLVVGDTVLSVGRSARGNQGEDCYVLSFDLATGKFRWACYVASSGMPADRFGGNLQWNDKTSHLAYANGRVYVLTNLGAVAALDAYSGTIVWLNIYPLDPPPQTFRGGGGFNPFLGGQAAGGGPRLKAWQLNPVLLADGKVFALPDEGKHLLVYDAISGREVKRLSLDQIARWNVKGGSGQSERPAALVGVVGPRMLLASETRLLCLDWPAYDDETFPGPDDAMIFWPTTVPGKLVGRPFLTAGGVYMCDDDRLRRLDLRTGLSVSDYPSWPRSWDEGEGPGNVVVSGDHVVVAGADAVNVYTDLALATTKLDREIAAAPTDPEPRLRYAEVMFVAGQGEQVVRRLDEAVKLLGGADKLAAGANRDRLFADAVRFATKSAADERPGARERVVQYFDRAAAAAATPQQQVQYRVARARFAARQQKDAAAAVKLYQEILAAPDTRAVTLLDEEANAPAQAEDVAERAIGELVKAAGPAVYEPYEQQARQAVEAAGTAADAATGKPDLLARAGKLLAVSQAFPNATVAADALAAAAGAFEEAGKPRDAVRVLRQMWFKHTAGPRRAGVLEGLARNYLAMSDRNRAEMAGNAAARLATAAALPGDPKLTKDLKLPDGTVVAAAGTPASLALDEVRKISSSEAGKSLPDFRVPVPPPEQERREKKLPYPKPFLPQAAGTTLPGAAALVLPARDYARPDRVVTWGANGLSVFAVGKGVPAAPLSTSRAFAPAGGGAAGALGALLRPTTAPAAADPAPPRRADDAGPAAQPATPLPRGVAWAGDTAVVWGASQAVAIDANTGRTLWAVDLATLPALEVIRGTEAPAPAVAANTPDQMLGGGVVLNGRFNGRPIRNIEVINGRVVQQQVQPAAAAPPAGPAAAPAPAVPPPPPPGGGEQVAEVRPIGDRVLVVSTTGRVLAADLAGGGIAWQARLAEKAPDRVVATEDFTVVRVSDDLTVRLFALDTYSGRVIGNKPFAVQGGNVPVNLALSGDGTLVYTMPDRLCLRDLYKAWDEDERVIPAGAAGGPPQPIYAGATQPGQLLIDEGRILAVADSVNVPGLQAGEKFVRVHSLETGQPLSLRYTMRDGGPPREVDRLLQAHTKDWNVMLRTVGSKLYVIGPKTVTAYNLDRPAETWVGSTTTFDPSATPDNNFRDAFVGTTHLVVLDQPTPGGPRAAGEPPPPPYRLYAFGRYGIKDTGESGRLDYSVGVSDPAGIAPQWQACDGGFFYATADGKVKALLGADQSR